MSGGEWTLADLLDGLKRIYDEQVEGARTLLGLPGRAVDKIQRPSPETARTLRELGRAVGAGPGEVRKAVQAAPETRRRIEEMSRKLRDGR